jgi:hypothetical protein
VVKEPVGMKAARMGKKPTSTCSQDDVDTGDMAKIPVAEEWTFPGQRFAIGKGVAENAAVKVFSAAAVWALQGVNKCDVPLPYITMKQKRFGKRPDRKEIDSLRGLATCLLVSHKTCPETPRTIPSH